MASGQNLRQLEGGLASMSKGPGRPPFHHIKSFLLNPRRLINFFLVLIVIVLGLLSLCSSVPPLFSLPPRYPAPDFPSPITKDVPVLSCHSHNDYWRPYPLLSGLQTGCISTEADIWALPGSPQGHLYVGHIRNSLVPSRTLKNMYLDPLTAMLEKANERPSVMERDVAEPNDWVGVFDTASTQSLTLLIDFKTSSEITFPSLLKALEPLHEKGWLTHVSTTVGSDDIVVRPLTIVLSGRASFGDLSSVPQPGRYVFFDAPLASLPATLPSRGHSNSSGPFHVFNATNSFYASTTLRLLLEKHNSQGTDLLRPEGEGTLAHELQTQIREAKEAGLRPRYWETPAWPIAVRNTVWRDLWQMGVAVLNVDDLKGVAAFWNT